MQTFGSNVPDFEGVSHLKTVSARLVSGINDSNKNDL